MAKLLGGLLYLTVWIAEISQFVAVVGIAILATAVIVWAAWGVIGGDFEAWKKIIAEFLPPRGSTGLIMLRREGR